MGYVTRAQLQRETGRSRSDVDKLFALGLPHEHVGTGKGGEIRVDRSRALAWLVGHVLDAAADPGGSSPEMVRERTRLYREQADGQGLKNAAARGELLPAEEVLAGWQAAIGRSRSLLLGIPPAVAARLVLLAREHEADTAAAERAMREHLVKAVDGALAELADTTLDELDDDAAGDARGDAAPA